MLRCLHSQPVSQTRNRTRCGYQGPRHPDSGLGQGQSGCCAAGPARDRYEHRSRVLLVRSHPERVRSETAFAKRAGANPISTSSGNVVRFWPNRSVDRRLNTVLYMVIIAQPAIHEQTRAYIDKRLKEGKTKKETILCLKRYLARSEYCILEAVNSMGQAA